MAVLSISFIGDGLRDALDPYLQNRYCARTHTIIGPSISCGSHLPGTHMWIQSAPSVEQITCECSFTAHNGITLIAPLTHTTRGLQERRGSGKEPLITGNASLVSGAGARTRFRSSQDNPKGDMTVSFNAELQLLGDLVRGRVSRRSLLQRGAVLGMGTSAMAALAAAAEAQEASPTAARSGSGSSPGLSLRLRKTSFRSAPWPWPNGRARSSCTTRCWSGTRTSRFIRRLPNPSKRQTIPPTSSICGKACSFTTGTKSKRPT